MATSANPGLIVGNPSVENIANNAVTSSVGATDDAHKLLGELFGNNWDNLFAGGGTNGTATALFDIFSYMNAVTLIAVAVLLFYVITVGIIGTAHEGEALGKRYSTLWTPIRSVSAIAMLMPLPSAGGISLLQALLLLCISVGSNSANIIWGKSIDYMQANGGSLVQSMPIDYTKNTFNLSSNILLSLVTQNYVANISGNTAAGAVQTQDAGDPSTTQWNFVSPVGDLAGKFGTIKLKCFDDFPSVCNAQKTALDTLIKDINPIASAVALKGVTQVDPVTMQDAMGKFNKAVFDAAQAEFATQNPKMQEHLDNFATTAKQTGWIQAGGWYWTIAGFQDLVQGAIDSTPEFTAPADTGSISQTGYTDIADVLAIMENYKVLTEETYQSASVDDGESTIISWIRDLVNPIFLKIPNAIVDATTKGDPVANLKSFGSTSLNWVGGAALTYAIAMGIANSPVASTLGKLADKVPLIGSITGIPKIVAGIAADTLKTLLMPLVILITPMIIFLLYITYYLPSIPFVLWVGGVVGWLILIMETIAIAPLWAAAHAIPEGEGFAGQHGKQGYMLFMNVLMRPALMVTGFFMAISLIKGVSWLVGQGLHLYFNTSTSGTLVGPLSAAAMSVIGLSMIIRSSHRCFDLITWMPDNAMKWIGGGGASLGDGGDEHRMSGMVMGAMRSVNGMKLGGGGGENPMLTSLQNIERALGGGGNESKGNSKDEKTSNALATGMSQAGGSVKSGEDDAGASGTSDDNTKV